WQISGLKPLFLEISADMLKFVPFAQKAGMTFIGETEGNLGRAARDMAYLLRLKKQEVDKYNNLQNEECGFLDQQMARACKAAALAEREGYCFSCHAIIDPLRSILSIASGARQAQYQSVLPAPDFSLQCGRALRPATTRSASLDMIGVVNGEKLENAP